MLNKMKEDESWPEFIAKVMVTTPLQNMVGISQLATFIFQGYAPRNPVQSFLTYYDQLRSEIKRASEGEEMKKPIQHIGNVIGATFGVPLAQAGKTAQFLSDAHATDNQQPADIIEYMRGLRTGESDLPRK